MANACVFLMENVNAEDMRGLNEDYFVNVGTGEEIKLKDLAILIKNIVSFKGEIAWDSSKPDGTPRKLLDLSKIRKLGWIPNVTLEEGVRRVYEWYRNQDAS
jgi:GDP-L-fucose synthase